MAGADVKLTSELNLDGAIRDANRLPSLIKPISLKFEGGLALGKITGQVSEFQKSLAASNARVLAFSASAGQLYTYVRVFDNILKSTIEVQKSLTNLNVVFGLSSRQLDTFASNLFKVASETGQSFKVASEAALEFSRQGLGVEETLRRTRDALTLTRLTGLEVAESIRSLTTAINGFNEAGLDSTAIINKLTSVDTSFAISARDIAQALTRVGSIAKDTGVSFDKLLGLITAARVTTGREGSVIATSLGTIFQRIERPQVLQQLKELRIVTEDANGQNLSADKILQNLAKSYAGLEQSQKNQIIQFAGGVRQGNVLRALLADLAKQNSVYEKATQASANATDIATKRQVTLNKTLSAQINETVNNFTQAAYRIGTITLTPSITRVLGIGNFLTKGINSDLNQQGQDAGQFLGSGLLKGIGNYLSGPGLALGAAVITRFFTNFIGFASKSLTQLLEIGSTRYAREQAIEQVLAREPALLAELNRLGNDNVLIQARITQELEKQLAVQNAKATATNAIYSGVASRVGGGLGLESEKAFKINSRGELALNKASGFIPNIKETLGALQAGYNPGQVRDLNISGLGKVTYNTAETVKSFPGLSQPAILPPSSSKAGGNYKKSFQAVHGFSPYGAAGMIPSHNAANGFFSNIDSPFKDPFNRPPATTDVTATVKQYIDLILKPSIKNSVGTFDSLAKEVQDFSKSLNLNNQSSKRLNDIFTKSFRYYNPPANPRIREQLESQIGSQEPFVSDISTTGERTYGSVGTSKQLGFGFSGLGHNIRGISAVESGGKYGFPQGNPQGELLPIASQADVFTQQAILNKAKQLQTLESVSRITKDFRPENFFTTKGTLGQNPDFGILRSSNFYSALKTQEAREQAQKSSEYQKFATGTDLKPGEFGPSASRFKYLQGIEEYKRQEIQNRGFTGDSVLGPDANTLLQFKQSQFSNKLNNNFGITSLINPFKYKQTEKEATQLQQLGSFRNRTSELQNKAFLASFITPIIGGVVEQAVQTNFGGTSTGRGFARAAGGGANIASFALTGAGVAGPYGALGGAGIGLITELPSIIKAFTDTLPDLEANLERIKDSTEKTTRGLSEFALASQQLADLYNTPEATKGQAKNVQSQLNSSLINLPPAIRNRLVALGQAGDESGINNTIGIESSIAKQKLSFQSGITALQKVPKGPSFGQNLEYGLNDFFAINSLSEKAGLKRPGFDAFLSKRDFETKQRENELKNQTVLFLRDTLGFQNSEGNSIEKQLTPQDFEKIRGAQGGNKVDVLSSIFGKYGVQGFNSGQVKKSFNTDEGIGVLNQAIDKVFNPQKIAEYNSNADKIKSGQEKINKAFSDFSGKLTQFQNNLDKFSNNIENSSIIRLALTSGNLRSNEIVQKTSNQLSLAKSGNNPFVANQFQFEEEKTRTQNQLTIELQKNSNETKNRVANILSQTIGGEATKIQQQILTRKEAGNISPQEEKIAEEQLAVLQRLLNNPQFLKVKELLQKPQNLTGQDLNKIDKFVGDQISVLDKLRQSTSENPEQIKGIAGQLGISPEDLKKIFDERVNLLNSYQKGFQELRKTTEDFKKGDLQARGNAFESNKVSSTQFAQNQRTIAPSVALSSDQQKILAAINENAARTGNGRNINFGQTVASGFQYNQAQFFNDLSKNTQDFGKQFKDAFAGAFAEAENSSKKFTDILKDRFLSLAQNITTKFVGQGLDVLFGSTLGKFAPTFSNALQGKAGGGLIKKYSNGGFVDMGSGTKDDVPAMLTGGEYVLTKHAVSSIGINNLDKLNNFSDQKVNGFADGDLVSSKQPNQYSYNYGKKNLSTNAGATLADSVFSTGTSASINLANAYLLKKKSAPFQQGEFNVSPLLSAYGATDSNNPQNQLKFSREKFTTNINVQNKKIASERSAFETNQLISLGIAYASAGVQAAGASYGSSKSPTPGQSYDLAHGQGPVSAEFANDTSSLYEKDVIGQAFPSYSPYLNSVSGFGNSKGGRIKKMAGGGMFGGDTSSDRTPAMLMGGEYVVKPSVVSKYGTNYFNNLNRKYAAGGYVGGSSYGNYDYSKLLSDQFQKSVDILGEISSKLGNNNSTSNIQNPSNNKSNVSNPNGSNANSSGVVNNVTVNITMSSTNGNGANTNGNNSSSSNSENQNDKNTAKQLGDLVQNQMMTLLISQSKSGGVLYERFQTRSR